MKPNEEFVFGSIRIPPAEKKNIKIKVSESYLGTPVYIPVTVINGAFHGPVLYVTATLHGDELNGMEIVRIIRNSVDPLQLNGTLLLVSIANPISFLFHNRDLPDKRDLNRCFPGRKNGSMAAHLAWCIFNKITKRAHYGIDLHTAGYGRINFPHIRADLRNTRLRELAFAFGIECVLDLVGDKGTLRRAASIQGIPTICFEAGEPLKFDKREIDRGVSGIQNVLSYLRMYPFSRTPPFFQIIVKEHKWIRAREGGIMVVIIKPGQVVQNGELIAYIVGPFGAEIEKIHSPFTGFAISTSIIPSANPGSPVAHIVPITDEKFKAIKKVSEQYFMPEE